MRGLVFFCECMIKRTQTEGVCFFGHLPFALGWQTTTRLTALFFDRRVGGGDGISVNSNRYVYDNRE